MDPSANPAPELVLTFPEDGLRAVVSTIHLRTTAAEVHELLERHGVRVGVSQRRIHGAIRTVRRTNRPVHDVVVAEGTRPRPPSRPRVRYHLPDGVDAPPLLDPVADLLSCSWDDVAAAAPRVEAWAVAPGDRLATVERTAGAEGLDVRDRPIAVPEPPEGLPLDPAMDPGPGVELTPDGAGLVASAYGYAGLQADRLAVLEPLWIAPDMMLACFLNLPGLGTAGAPAAGAPAAGVPAAGAWTLDRLVAAGLDADALGALLESAGITFGVDHEELRALASRPVTEPLLPLARGVPPSSGAEQTPDFTHDWSFRAGSFRDDGSIDFRERNIFPAASSGELLARCESVASGTPGRTVFGIDIDPPGGQVALELDAGENARLCVRDEVQCLYATCDGGVVLSSCAMRDDTGAVAARRYTMAVQPLAHIEGDVGLETGHVDFRGNVIVDGSVTAGFRVKATGGIAVAGSVEAGASLQAGGDITVQQGIVGRETRVQAGGVVGARFVQEARVQAGGDIAIGSYAHGAHLHTRAAVRVEGLGRAAASGGIVGGETWALGGITSPNAGSARTSSTHLYAGVSAEDVDRLHRARQTVLRARSALDSLLRDIGLPELTAPATRALVAAEPERRDAILAGVREARQLEQTHDQLVRDEQALIARVAAVAVEAPVDVLQQAFADVAIQIGDRQLVLGRDLTQVRFRLDPAEPELVAGALPLSGEATRPSEP